MAMALQAGSTTKPLHELQAPSPTQGAMASDGMQKAKELEVYYTEGEGKTVRIGTLKK
jgi:hypothetical protein